jgi:biotin transport system substrate-specific component
MNSTKSLAQPVLACLFAALTSIGAYIAIPLPGTPVPIVLQNLFIMLAALTLGPVWGLAATAIYLTLGALGLPVFSGGTGGLARFLGPTGGYLVAYIPAVAVMGLVSRVGRRAPGRGAVWMDGLALLLGTAIVYALGVSRLKYALGATWTKAVAVGLLPFIPGDIVKMALALVLSRRIAPWLDEELAESRREGSRGEDGPAVGDDENRT